MLKFDGLISNTFATSDHKKHHHHAPKRDFEYTKQAAAFGSKFSIPGAKTSQSKAGLGFGGIDGQTIFAIDNVK